MSTTGKKIFLALSIIVPFLIYCIYYYSIMIKNAPYNFSELESVTFKYGEGDQLVNQYNSGTQTFQYLNRRDSLIKKHVKLRQADLKYIHAKASMMGFWNFPDEMRGSNADAERTAVHYYLELKYKRKTKSVLFSANFNQNEKLLNAAKTLINEVNKTINDAEDRQ